MHRRLAHVGVLAAVGLFLLAAAAAPAQAAGPAPATSASVSVFEAPATLAVRRASDDLASRKLRTILYADRWNRARSLYELGDYPAAAAYYLTLVNEPIGEKYLYEVRFRLADCLAHAGAYPGAIKYYSMVRSSDPNGKYAALAEAHLAQLSVRLGAIEKARQDFARSVGSGAERSKAAYALGHFLAPVAPTEATLYLSRVEPKTRYYAEAQYHLGALAATSPTGYAAARKHFAFARAALPASAPTGPGADPAAQGRIDRIRELISLSLARIYADEHAYALALDEYRGVPEGGRYRDAALLESAWVLLRLDQVIPALDNVQSLLRERPESPMVLEASLLVGYLTIEQGKFNAAYGHFEDIRQLLEGLETRLNAYASAQTSPESFYYGLVEAEHPVTLPAQIASWVQEGTSVKTSNRLLDEVRDIERDMRDIYRQLDEVEAMAAGPRGGPRDPAGLDNLIRLDLSNAMYRLQGRILELRLRPFLRFANQRERDILRLIRRVRTDLISIRNTPADLNQLSASRQVVLTQLSQYLLQIHPEIGLDTTKRIDEKRVAEVDNPLSADEYLRGSRRDLAELSREVTLDDRWFDAALEYTVYLEDRLQGAMFRRLGATERFDFLKRVSVLFRQSVELQHTLRDLGNTLAGIQESIFLDIRGRSVAERKVLASYQGVARDIDRKGRTVRGLVAREEYARVSTQVADTAVRADLGALDTGWRVKEMEDLKVRELLGEKQDRLHKLESYYAGVVSATAGPGPYEGVEDLNPERLAQTAGSADSPYGRELLGLGRDVVELARSLQLLRIQQESLARGAEPAILTPEELAAERQRRASGAAREPSKLELKPGTAPAGSKKLPVTPEKRK